jgi:hypothetical protein
MKNINFENIEYKKRHNEFLKIEDKYIVKKCKIENFQKEIKICDNNFIKFLEIVNHQLGFEFKKFFKQNDFNNYKYKPVDDKINKSDRLSIKINNNTTNLDLIKIIEYHDSNLNTHMNNNQHCDIIISLSNIFLEKKKEYVEYYIEIEVKEIYFSECNSYSE